MTQTSHLTAEDIEKMTDHSHGPCQIPYCICHSEEENVASARDAVIDGLATPEEAYRLVNGLQL